MEWLFGTHDRTRELKESAPHSVRNASHELANATMAVERGAKDVRRQADALVALVNRMQERDCKKDKDGQ